MMYRSCSKCGKMHKYNEPCNIKRKYSGGQEREMRSSWKWQKKSVEIKDKAQYLCEVCRDQGRYTYDNLEVHHIIKVRQNPDRVFDNYNLICLCREHHRQAEEGDLSQDYLFELAKKRERS